LVTLLLPLIVSACFPFPHRHLKRPAVAFTVSAISGDHLANAHVRLYGGILVGSSIRWRTPVNLDARGSGSVDAQREWHWFAVLLPDGEAPWRWAWCADAPGFRRKGADMARAPHDTVRISLIPGSGPPCSDSVHSLYDVARE